MSCFVTIKTYLASRASLVFLSLVCREVPSAQNSCLTIPSICTASARVLVCNRYEIEFSILVFRALYSFVWIYW